MKGKKVVILFTSFVIGITIYTPATWGIYIFDAGGGYGIDKGQELPPANTDSELESLFSSLDADVDKLIPPELEVQNFQELEIKVSNLLDIIDTSTSITLPVSDRIVMIDSIIPPLITLAKNIQTAINSMEDNLVQIAKLERIFQVEPNRGELLSQLVGIRQQLLEKKQELIVYSQRTKEIIATFEKIKEKYASEEGLETENVFAGAILEVMGIESPEEFDWHIHSLKFVVTEVVPYLDLSTRDRIIGAIYEKVNFYKTKAEELEEFGLSDSIVLSYIQKLDEIKKEIVELPLPGYELLKEQWNFQLVLENVRRGIELAGKVLVNLTPATPGIKSGLTVVIERLKKALVNLEIIQKSICPADILAAARFTEGARGSILLDEVSQFLEIDLSDLGIKLEEIAEDLWAKEEEVENMYLQVQESYFDLARIYVRTKAEVIKEEIVQLQNVFSHLLPDDYYAIQGELEKLQGEISALEQEMSTMGVFYVEEISELKNLYSHFQSVVERSVGYEGNNGQHFTAASSTTVSISTAAEVSNTTTTTTAQTASLPLSSSSGSGLPTSPASVPDSSTPPSSSSPSSASGLDSFTLTASGRQESTGADYLTLDLDDDEKSAIAGLWDDKGNSGAEGGAISGGMSSSNTTIEPDLVDAMLGLLVEPNQLFANYNPFGNKESEEDNSGVRANVAYLLLSSLHIAQSQNNENALSGLSKLIGKFDGQYLQIVGQSLPSISEKIINLYSQGKSVEEISGYLGCSQDLVRQIVAWGSPVREGDIKYIDIGGDVFLGVEDVNGNTILKGDVYFKQRGKKGIEYDNVKISQLMSGNEEVLHEISRKSGITVENLKAIKEVIENQKDGGFFKIVVLEVDGKQRILVIKGDTIVYITSTKPSEIVKEIIKKVFLKKPQASDVTVNRILILLILLAVVCMAGGIALAVVVTRREYRRWLEYQPPVYKKPSRETKPVYTKFVTGYHSYYRK